MKNMIMEQEKFSWRKRMNSFQYALSGWRLLFKSEHNSWLHFAATIIVIISAFLFRVTANEAGLLTVAIGIVWIAELFNTCIEKMMDFISKEVHPAIKLIKDVSAGAVLMAALTSVIIGCFVFIPKILTR
jgi:diacylglycerol kinase (ATP)